MCQFDWHTGWVYCDRQVTANRSRWMLRVIHFEYVCFQPKNIYYQHRYKSCKNWIWLKFIHFVRKWISPASLSWTFIFGRLFGRTIYAGNCFESVKNPRNILDLDKYLLNLSALVILLTWSLNMLSFAKHIIFINRLFIAKAYMFSWKCQYRHVLYLNVIINDRVKIITWPYNEQPGMMAKVSWCLWASVTKSILSKERIMQMKKVCAFKLFLCDYWKIVLLFSYFMHAYL